MVDFREIVVAEIGLGQVKIFDEFNKLNPDLKKTLVLLAAERCIENLIKIIYNKNMVTSYQINVFVDFFIKKLNTGASDLTEIKKETMFDFDLKFFDIYDFIGNKTVQKIVNLKNACNFLDCTNANNPKVDEKTFAFQFLKIFIENFFKSDEFCTEAIESLITAMSACEEDTPLIVAPF